MAIANDDVTLQIDGHEVTVTHPAKLLIPQAGVAKLDLVNYYLAVAEGALRGAGGRPCVLVRYPNGIDGEFFFQKRAPGKRPAWIEVATIRFPSGRSAEDAVAALERAVRLQPDLRDARYALAQALTRASRRADAERHLAEFQRQRAEALAREQRALDLEALRSEAATLSTSGRHRQAIDAWKKAGGPLTRYQ